MGKSIDPMGVGQRKRSRERSRPPLPALIVSLSLRPGIPWRVALQHCPPPLPRLAPCLATRWWSTKPPPQPGWGIFNRRKRDFSSGLDTSTDFLVSPVIRLPCSADFSTGRGGFLQLLSMSLSPCCPYHPAGVTQRLGQSASCHAAFTRDRGARPPRFELFEATCGFTLVTAR